MPHPDTNLDVVVRAPQQYLAGLIGPQGSEEDVSTLRNKRSQRGGTKELEDKKHCSRRVTGGSTTSQLPFSRTSPEWMIEQNAPILRKMYLL